VGLIDRQKLGAEPQTDHRDIDGLRHGSRPPYDSEEKGERKTSVNKKSYNFQNDRHKSNTKKTRRNRPEHRLAITDLIGNAAASDSPWHKSSRLAQIL
jgi:hypothetical protein